MRTLRRLGITSVVVYHRADAGGLAVREADEAVELQGDPPVSAYLNIEAIIDACGQTDADAVHPGFGFLAENADFAQAVTDAGVTFIGPRPHAMRAMGDKIESKRLAKKAGVPTLPGSDGALESADEALKEAERIGYPVLLKASAGGGGKGMRIARDANACREAFERSAQEATAAFGDGRVFLERYIDRPRHIEIQVLADGHGNVLSLGERECSIQRRYQKVVEEAPSPFVDEATRRAMGERAVELARAVDYVSAGTVEMVADAQGNFYFLEMNTRLQVEHPVTELVTGIDIVEQQLRIAGGEPLAITQDDLRITGHAIECRVYAEDADNGFIPATGPLHLVRFPIGEGVRVDHGVREGQRVSAAFDPMLAKVIGYGATREQAIERTRHALEHTVLLGTTTNTAFLERVLAHQDFVAGATHTGFLDEHAEIAQEPATGLRAGAPAARGRRARQPALRMANDPARTAGIDGRVEAVIMGLQISIDAGELHDVVLTRREAHPATIWIDGKEYPAQLRPVGRAYEVTLDEHTEPVWIAVDHDTVYIHAFGRAWETEVVDPAERSGQEGEQTDTATAPMPGTVVSVAVGSGDAVTSGQPLMVIESMKMLSEITAWRDGVIERVHLGSGDTFDMGARLITLEADNGDGTGDADETDETDETVEEKVPA